MSAAPRHRSSWWSQYYDKLMLVIILAGLCLSAFFLFMKIGQKRQELTEAAWAKMIVAPKKVEPIEPQLAQFDRMKSALSSPFQSGQFSNRMFISELRVSCVECQKPIPFDATMCPFCQAKQPTSIPPAKMDSANDYPSPAAKLRMIRAGSNPFKLRFQGEALLSNGMVYQLNLRSLERTYFVRIGDEVEGFKVIECVTNALVGPTLILKQGDTLIPLVKGKMREGFEMVAELVFLIDQKKMIVRFGDMIKLKDQEYKVIDIRRDGVLIRDERTRKVTEVGPLSDSEKNVLESGLSEPPPRGYAIPGVMRPPQ